MRPLPLILLTAAALLVPGQALGASAPPVTARSFVITGLVLGDQKIEASGKIGIEGGKLIASVGCNTIGGDVRLEGDLVTITDPLTMTAMGCLGSVAATEDAFVKILMRGPFRIASGAWVGSGAQILVDELAVTPPDPNAQPPDEPVGSSPGAVIVDPVGSCPPIDIDPGFGGSGAGNGGGSTGSGGSTGTGGVSGTGGTSTGNEGSGTSSGENPAQTADAGPSGTAVAELPATPQPKSAATMAPDQTATPGTEPAATPGTEPGGTPDPNAVPPIAPAPDGTPSSVEPAPGASAAPAPDGSGAPPPPAGTPGPCGRVSYANDGLTGAGSAAGEPPAAADLAEHAKAAAFDAATVVPVAILVLLGFVVTGLAIRRWRVSRPGSEADASR